MSDSLQSIRVGVFQSAGTERNALVHVLRLDGFDVVVVGGEEQARRLAESPPDVAVVDLSGRGASAPRWFQQYRDRQPNTPAFALGTMHEDRQRWSELNFGLERFFVKPINPSVFLMRLKAAVGAPRRGDDIVPSPVAASRIPAVPAMPVATMSANGGS